MSISIEWEPIKQFLMDGGSYNEAAIKFDVKPVTIRSQARRKCWPIPKLIAKLADARAVAIAQNRAITEETVKTLAERGEEHAKVVFDLASNALRELKRLPVKNWKDAEIADKAARRAAGLGNDDEGVKISLIQLNEAIDSHTDDSTIVEAEIVSDVSESLALPEQTTGT